MVVWLIVKWTLTVLIFRTQNSRSISKYLVYALSLLPIPWTMTTMAHTFEALPFYPTSALLPILNGKHQQSVSELTAVTSKSFINEKNMWICYKQNHITICCSFCWELIDTEGSLFTSKGTIHQFGLSIFAKTEKGGDSASLLQYPTTTRHKNRSIVPRQKVFTLHDYCENSRTASTSISCTFERVHFQNASFKGRLREPERFSLVVKVSANLSRDREGWVTIATKESHPVTVRGRSPSYFHASRCLVTPQNQISNLLKHELVAGSEDVHHDSSSSCPSDRSRSLSFLSIDLGMAGPVQRVHYPQGKNGESLDSPRYGTSSCPPIVLPSFPEASLEMDQCHKGEAQFDCIAGRQMSPVNEAGLNDDYQLFIDENPSNILSEDMGWKSPPRGGDCGIQ